MSEYTEAVQKASSESNGRDLLHNRTPIHAAIIIAELFRRATKSVRIICQRLNDGVYGDAEVIDAAMYYLYEHPTATLEILVESDVSAETNVFLRRMKQEGLLSRISVRKIPSKFQESYKHNFMLVDDIHYRYEPDRAACEAVALFGNSQDGKHLRAAFESLKRVSLPLVM